MTATKAPDRDFEISISEDRRLGPRAGDEFPLNPYGRPDQMLFRGKDRSGNDIRFVFQIQPSQLKRTRKKLGQYILTKFGYERQNWGNDLFTFEYSGSSGVFRPEDGWKLTGVVDFDVRDTHRWQVFREFEIFYEDSGNDQNMVRMSYWGYEAEFIGSLDDFSFTHDVNKEPYAINYNFKYTALPLRRPKIETKIQAANAGDPEDQTGRSDVPA